jgi:hypothetical protein
VNVASLKPFVCPHCERRFRTEGAVADHGRDAHGIAPVACAVATVEDPKCIECGSLAALVSGGVIYPHRPDLFQKRFWLCECGAYCGCHGYTTRPLGFPCGPETRQARMAAHDAFDPLWRSRRMGRRDAYTWLSKAMGLPPEQTHIGMMTREQAREVVAHCLAREQAA